MLNSTQNVTLRESAAGPEAAPAEVREAATIKARVRRISRELAGLLTDKTVPESLRKQVEGFQKSLNKTWAELEREAGQENGHRGSASSKESGDPLEEGDYYGDYVPSSIITFTQLDQANAAREIAESMRERVIQFQSMLNNIFFWSDTPDKIAAAQALFDEFVGVMGDVLEGKGEGSSSMMDAAAETAQMAESYQPAITIAEASGDANPRGPLEMDVQLIQPGWGNARDNHYYPADMLKRDAKVFVGAKMYATDHIQSEKSVRTEVSKIKGIVGFSEAGAPIARVVVFDPDFAEAARNRARAGELESLECSILADGRARSGYEQGGRRGKIVEAITAVASVDWVTRAGAGGKALNLAESDAQPETEETPAAQEVPAAQAVPAAESAAETPVTIREEDQVPVDEAPVETPAAEETPAEAPAEETPAEETPAAPEVPEEEAPATESAAPVYLGEAEVHEALAKTNLPPASVLALARGQYETADALRGAIAGEIRRIKEISGSGRPFGLGETAAPDSTKPPASRSQIEETMDKINSRFGIGR